MECAICLNELTKNIIIINCKHKYHSYCIKEMNDYCKHKNKELLCPICRESIEYKMNIDQFIEYINDKIEKSNSLRDSLNEFDGMNNFNLPDNIFFQLLVFQKNYFYGTYKLINIFNHPYEKDSSASLIKNLFSKRKYFSLDLDKDGITQLVEHNI